jgi:hypothetical protein
LKNGIVFIYMKKPKDKITRSHTTSIEAVKPFLDFAKSHPEITKISLGIIKPIKTSHTKRIKTIPEPACLLVQIRGVRAIQTIRFFTKDPNVLKKDIDSFAYTSGFEISK